MKDPPIEIKFFVNGQAHVMKHGFAVPRFGDEVMLYTKSTNRKEPYRVKRVVWGVEADTTQNFGEQAVNIDVEKIK